MAARDVQFIIRARDEASRQLDSISHAFAELVAAQGQMAGGTGAVNRDLSELVRVLAGFDRASKSILTSSDRAGEAFHRQAARVDELKAELKSLEGQIAGSSKALDQVRSAGAATGDNDAAAAQATAIEAAQAKLLKSKDRLLGKIKTEETALKSLGGEYQKLASMANAVDAMAPGVANLQQTQAAAAAARDQADAAERLREMLDPSVAIQKRYAKEIERARDLRAQDLITAQELAETEKLLNNQMKREVASAGKGERGIAGRLGLKPYEWTNLGYQINDVVTQLGSGTSFMQTMAQQGGQLLQLFPKIGSVMLAAFTNPAFLAAAGVFSVIAIGVKEAADQASRLRTIAGLLRANADGAAYSAEALEGNVAALDRMGMTAEEALDSVRALLKEGVNPDFITAFGAAGKDMAKVYGTDVTDAVGQVATAFTGGYDAIVELDRATNFLTASERAHMRMLFESGRAADARSAAFAKFEQRMDAAADKAKGEWSKAGSSLTESWDNFTRSLGENRSSKTLLNLTDSLAGMFQKLADAMDEARAAKERLDGASSNEVPWWRRALALASTGGAVGVGTLSRPPADVGQSVTVKLPPVGDPKGDDEAAAKRLADARSELDLQRLLLDATSDLERAKVAGEIAYREEIEKSGDAAVAQLKRVAAEEAEQTRIQRERRADLIATARGFLGRDEDNRQDNAVLQSLFAQFGIKAPSGARLDPDKVAWCAAFVNAMLASKGIAGSGSLSAASFKNFGTGVGLEDAEKGDIVVVSSKNAASGSHVGFFEGFDAKGNVRVLGGNQGKGSDAVSVDTFARSRVQAVRRVGDIGEGVEGLDSEIQKQIELATAQSDFNHKLAEEAAGRQLAIKYLKEQLGLSAEQMFASQRRQQIEQAVTAAARDAAERNLEFSDAQRQQIEQTVGAQFDLEHAEERVNAVLSEQQQLRDSLLAGIEEASRRGDSGTVARLTAELDAAAPALDSAIAAVETFWKRFDTPEARAALESLRGLRQEIRDTGAALAQLEIDRLDRRIGGLTDLQGATLRQVDMAQLLGDEGSARAAERQLEDINLKLIAVRQAAIEAWEALAGDPEKLAALGLTSEQVQAIVLDLKQAQAESAMLGRQFLMTGRQINESLADMGVGMAENFLRYLGEGRSAIDALWMSFAQFAADFLMQMGQMILKQQLFNLLSAQSQSGGGGVGGAIASAIGGLFPAAVTLQASGATLAAAGGTLTGAATGLGVSAASLMAAAQTLIVANSMASAGVFHGGGIAGAASMARPVHPSIFAGAARFHRGGMPGLRPDEVPAILQRGEEVLTRGDPRHRLNGGGAGDAGGGIGSLKVVGVFDPDEIPNAMASSRGERVILTSLSRNRQAARQALGIDK